MPRKPTPKKLPPGMALRGNVYWARFSSGGKLVQKRLSSDLKTATKILNEMRVRADKRAAGYVDNDVPWSDIRNQYLAQVEAKNPRRAKEVATLLEKYTQRMNPCTVEEITLAAATRYQERRPQQNAWGGRRTKRKVSAATVNKELGALKQALQWAASKGKIGHNPLRDLANLEQTPTKERRALEAYEVEAILAASWPNMRRVWRFFLHTGLRRGNVTGLTWADVDLEARVVTIPAARAKTKRDYEVPLSDEVVADLIALKAEAHRFRDDFVFHNDKGRPLNNYLLREFYKTCQRAGIKGGHQMGSIDLHAARTTLATAVAGETDQKAAYDDAGAVLQHAPGSKVTGAYIKPTVSQIRNKMARVPYLTMSHPGHILPVPNPGNTLYKNGTANPENGENAMKMG